MAIMEYKMNILTEEADSINILEIDPPHGVSRVEKTF